MYRSPVYGIRAVPIEKIRPNEYNPNSVAPPEMRLLYDSIKCDGYTMPIVCYYDAAADSQIYRGHIIHKDPGMYPGIALGRGKKPYTVYEQSVAEAVNKPRRYEHGKV